MAGQTVVVSVLADTKKFASGLNGASSDLSDFGRTLGKVAIGVAAGVTAVSVAAVAGATAVVRSFAELEQNIGGSEAVFGEFARTIQREGAEAYRQLGISQSEYLATANKMGSLFQGSGLTQQRSLELTTQAMQRAADMASVMGIQTSAAMEAVTGAAKGNFTMMDNLGVAMNATALEAYALEKGINFEWNTASQAEKAELAMQMFMDRTAQYAGNFVREATETISGSVGMLRASWQTLIAGLGDSQADVDVLVGNVVESFRAVVKNVTPVLENLADVGPAAISELVEGITDALPAILKVGGSLITSLLAGIVKSLPKIVPAALNTVVSLTTTILGMLPTIIQAGISMIVALVQGIAQALPTLIPAAVDAIVQSILTLLAPENLTALLDAGLALLTGLVQGLLDAIPVLVGALPEIITAIVTFVVSAIPQLIEAGIALLVALVGALPEIIDAIVAAIPEIIIGITTALIASIPKIIEAGIKLLVSLIAELPTIILEIISAMPQIVAGIVMAFTKPETIARMGEAGKDLIRGLWQGISSMGGWLWRQVENFAGGVVDWWNSIWGIRSPSRVFAGIGRYAVEGLEKGLAAPNSLGRIMSDLSEQVTGGFAGALDVPGGALEVGGAGGGNVVINLTVQTLTGGPEVGRHVVNALQEYLKAGGTGLQALLGNVRVSTI